MNKKIVLGVCIALVVAIVIAIIAIALKPDNISNNEDIENAGNKENNESLYNGGNEATEGMEPINKDMVLGDILNQIKKSEVEGLKGISDTEANNLIDLKEYVGLEKKVAKYEDDDEFTEVWLFKISKQEQAVEIFRMFNDRIEDLREEYKNDAKISEILNNENNIKMKQQAGIAIVIISDSASRVERALDVEFVK